MDLARFKSTARGQLVPIVGHDPRFGEDYDHFAYLPDLLPDPIVLTADTWGAVTSASDAVARLDQAVSNLPNPRLLTRPAIRREAQSTSALEGTFVAFTDVLEADFVSRDDMAQDIREVYNSVVAAELAFEALATRGITRGLLQDLQREIVKQTPADNDEAGRVRQTQVFIGARRRRVREARFIPPPPGPSLEAGVDALLKWNEQVTGPALLRAALTHYQFETLHPFTDGNGRLGRLLVILQLMESGQLREPVLNLSPWFEAQRSEYQDRLLEVSCTGEFDPWVQFFCDAVQDQARAEIARIEQLLTWKNAMLFNLTNRGMRGVVLTIAEDLIGYPYINPTLASSIYNRTYQACNTAIGKLVELGILRERTGRSWGRIFFAPDVIRMVES